MGFARVIIDLLQITKLKVILRQSILLRKMWDLARNILHFKSCEYSQCLWNLCSHCDLWINNNVHSKLTKTKKVYCFLLYLWLSGIFSITDTIFPIGIPVFFQFPYLPSLFPPKIKSPVSIVFLTALENYTFKWCIKLDCIGTGFNSDSHNMQAN